MSKPMIADAGVFRKTELALGEVRVTREEAHRDGSVDLEITGFIKGDPEKAEQSIRTIQNVMWRQAGVVRTSAGLQEAQSMLSAVDDRLPAPVSRRSCEARNIFQAASLIVRSALARKESRGAHYRTDFPATEDGDFKKHSVVRNDKISFE